MRTDVDRVQLAFSFLLDSLVLLTNGIRSVGMRPMLMHPPAHALNLATCKVRVLSVHTQ